MSAGPPRQRGARRPARRRRSKRTRLAVATSLFVLVAAVGSCVDGLGGRRDQVRLAAEQAGATVSSTAEAAPEAAAPPTTARARTRASTSTAPPTTARVKATAPPTTRRPRPTTTAASPAPGCHPSYSGCLRIGIGDYDCAGGSGNGPNYVEGPVRVRGIDPFDLDRDGNGWGCEG